MTKGRFQKGNNFCFGRITRGWDGTCPGISITDQITDQYAPYCSELRYAVSSEYIELADYWWMQQEMNTLSVRQIT